MSMSVLQIRLEEDLKNQVSELFDEMGMDIPTAVRIFFKQVLIEKGLPFNIKAVPSVSSESLNLLTAMRALNEEAKSNGVAGMSEDEIEAEIKATRAERKKH